MPSPRNYVRDYTQERLTETPKRKKKRVQRNAARSKMIKAGKVKKGDGKDVDHKNRNTADNSKSNLRAVKASTNRSYSRKANSKKYGNGKRK